MSTATTNLPDEPTDAETGAWLAQAYEVEDLDWDRRTGWSEHRIHMPWVAYVDDGAIDRAVLCRVVAEFNVYRDNGKAWRVDVATISGKLRNGRPFRLIDEDLEKIRERVEGIVAEWGQPS